MRTDDVVLELNKSQPWRENPYYVEPGDLFTRTMRELQRRRDEKVKEKIKHINQKYGLLDEDSTNAAPERVARQDIGIWDGIRREVSLWLGVALADLLVLLLIVFSPALPLFRLVKWPIYVYRRWSIRLIDLTGDPREKEVPNYEHPDYDLSIAKLRFKYVFITQLTIVACGDLLFLALG